MSEAIHCPRCNAPQVLTPEGTPAATSVTGNKQFVCLACGHSWKVRQPLKFPLAPEDEGKTWRRAFYEAYEAEDYARADELYRQRHAGYGKEATNVHEAFEQELLRDNKRVQKMLLATTIFSVIALLLIWLVSSC
jgi:hypothetical protein